MNWLAFYTTLLIITNVVGVMVWFYILVDYSTWVYKADHKTQRNWLIAVFIAFAIEIATIVGLNSN